MLMLQCKHVGYVLTRWLQLVHPADFLWFAALHCPLLALHCSLDTLYTLPLHMLSGALVVETSISTARQCF
jgi:hypothetical protein